MTLFCCSIGDNNPSPNAYTLPSLLGTKVPGKTSSAAYSMTPKASVGSFSEDLAKTPGPGCYDAVRPDQCVRKAPSYSMLGRSNVPRGIYYIGSCINNRIKFCTLCPPMHDKYNHCMHAWADYIQWNPSIAAMHPWGTTFWPLHIRVAFIEGLFCTQIN